MKTIYRFMKRLLVLVLVVTGVLALGTALGSRGCTAGLSLVTRAAREMAGSVESLWHSTEMLARRAKVR